MLPKSAICSTIVAPTAITAKVICEAMDRSGQSDLSSHAELGQGWDKPSHSPKSLGLVAIFSVTKRQGRWLLGIYRCGWQFASIRPQADHI